MQLWTFANSIIQRHHVQIDKCERLDVLWLDGWRMNLLKITTKLSCLFS
jgi:Zn-finger nucleic acid-binding protein